jgi:hypothetical protein
MSAGVGDGGGGSDVNWLVAEVNMRMRLILIAILFGIASRTAQADPSKYEFKSGKDGESVEVRVEDKHTVFAISGKLPRGGITIRLTDGDWPPEVILRLNKFDNVESFSATTDRLTFGGSLGLSSGGVKAFSRKLPFRFPNSKGEFEDGPCAGTLDVVIERGKEGLDFKLPTNLFVGSRDVRISWLVFTR